MSEIVPFQPGMIFGRTYDVRNMSVGTDIFTKEALATLSTTEIPESDFRYHDIQNSQNINKALGVSGEFSLKVKAGIVNADVTGSYINRDRSNENTIDIMCKAHVKTVVETMTCTDLRPDWNKNLTGTHYIRSITYGGNMFVDIEIQASDSEHMNNIRGKISAGLTLEGVLTADAKAELQKLEQEIRGSSKMLIAVHATILIDRVPRDIESMLKELDTFNSNVKQQDNGKGSPLTCELVPLSTLDPTIPDVVRYKGIDAQLIRLEEMYDDVRQAASKLDSLLSRDDLSDEQEKEAWGIHNNISTVFTIFSTVISQLDVTQDEKQLNPAFGSYNAKTVPGGFKRMVTLLDKSLKAPTGST